MPHDHGIDPKTSDKRVGVAIVANLILIAAYIIYPARTEIGGKLVFKSQSPPTLAVKRVCQGQV